MNDCITISGNGETVTMPRTRAISYGVEEVGKSQQMASGLIVKDMIGHRVTVTAEYDYMPNDTVVAVNALLRKSPFMTVYYPSPEGMMTDVFELEPLSVKMYDMRGGVSVWHECTLTMRSKRVVT